jgi:hypothetical protein
MLRYLNAILAIEPTSAQHRWLRAIVLVRNEDRAGAAADVEWLLEHKPEGLDLSRVRQMQQALEEQGAKR